MTDITKNEDLISVSDQLALELYNRKLYKESIEQNRVTLGLLGFRNPHVLKNIASACYEIRETEKAYRYFKEYMEITKSTDKQDIRIYAQYLTRTNRFDEARDLIFNKQENCIEKHLDMGWFLHREGRFKEAFIETEIGRNGCYWGGERMPPNCDRWTGQPIRGLNICVAGEAGLGDEMIFCRWLTKLKEMGAKVYYLTNNSLLQIITRNFKVFPYDPSVKYDYWVPSMSLPYLLKEEEPGDKIYLTPNPLYVAKWQNKLSKYKDIIVLNWTGDQNHIENKFREIPINHLVPQIRNMGTLVSVCMDAKECPEGVIDLTEDIKDWDDTLAILSLSKMCFTMSSSVSVAAGALGIKTFLYDIVVGYFTWCATENGSKTNWFHDVTVWRQESMNDWHTVINNSLSSLSYDSQDIG